MSVAATRGWISIPYWGWEHASATALIRSTAFMSVGYLAAAWNEEMVFRGYGFETLRAAIGQRAATGVLIPVFGLYHGLNGLNSQLLVGTMAAGTALTMLRLYSDALWLPVGYHWVWNILQTAVFGPPDAAPSIRPLQVHGPYFWVGRPGNPEPGVLSTCIHFTMALLVWLWMRHSTTPRRRLPVS